MATAIGLVEAGARKNGRFKRGSVDKNGAVPKGWRVRVQEAGLVLDYAPELADHGDLTLDAAHKDAAKDAAVCTTEGRRKQRPRRCLPHGGDKRSTLATPRLKLVGAYRLEKQIALHC